VERSRARPSVWFLLVGSLKLRFGAAHARTDSPAEHTTSELQEHDVGRKTYLPRTIQAVAALIGPETHSVQPARAQAPASPPAGPPDHRSASVLAFLCSCVTEGWWGQTGRCTMFCRKPRVGRPMENRSIPASQDPLLCSPMKGKTPLVLPYEGERRKGLGFAQSPEPGSLPRRGLRVIPWRDRESLPPRRMCL